MADKFLKFMLMVLVTTLTCMVVLWALPRLLTPPNTPTPGSVANPPTATSSSGSANNSAGGTSSLPPITATGMPDSNGLPNLAPPKTDEQRAIEDYERQRAPFYTFLRDRCGKLVIEGKPALDDRSVLTLYCTRTDNAIITDILKQIVQPYAYSYGFRHIRFYLPNPQGSVERYHLAAEANWDEQTRTWQAFYK